MEFAAQIWVNENKWQGDYRLVAISVTGNPPIVIDLQEL